MIIKDIENFIVRNNWVFAKTMAEIPHYYIVRDNLLEDDKKLFDKFDLFIKKNGYTKKFYSKQYTYYNLGNYKYWAIENILNRAELELYLRANAREKLEIVQSERVASAGGRKGGLGGEFRPPSPASSVRIFSNRHR